MHKDNSIRKHIVAGIVTWLSVTPCFAQTNRAGAGGTRHRDGRGARGESCRQHQLGLRRCPVARRTRTPPALAPRRLVEYVPGMVATQHSGAARRTSTSCAASTSTTAPTSRSRRRHAGEPRTHGHGQGYTDLNFLIPELIEARLPEGPYSADVGDFSSAGSVDYRLVERCRADSRIRSSASDGYGAACSRRLAEDRRGRSPTASSAAYYDGPWDASTRTSSKLQRVAELSRRGDAGNCSSSPRWATTADWHSPDQMPQRAVDGGLIDRFGSLDTTLRRRVAALLAFRRVARCVRRHVHPRTPTRSTTTWSSVSNFTYFLDDPADGDQFRSSTARATGFGAAPAWQGRTGACARAGRTTRRHRRRRPRRTQARAFSRPFATTAWTNAASLRGWTRGTRLTQSLRVQLGGRYDRYTFDVDALQPENSGRTEAGIASFKGELAWRVAGPAELYLDWGQGFHSNDARGTTIRVDPVTGDPVDRVTPLVRSRGSELGLRVAEEGRWQATLALWRLDLASELLFVGDAGTTEASPPSKRHGIELGAYWFADPRARLELEAAYTQSRFTDADPAGDRIPGAVPWIVSTAWSSEWARGWHSSARVRYVGDAPLIEDDRIRSGSSTMVNLAVGKRWRSWNFELDVLNALDSDDHDIEYFHASRLPGELDEGVEDVHFHAFEPRSLRLRATYTF